jgi:hypothetical protein
MSVKRYADFLVKLTYLVVFKYWFPTAVKYG